MELTKNKKIILSIGIIIILLMIYISFDKKSKKSDLDENLINNATSSVGNIGITGDYKIEQVSFDEKILPPVPDLNRQLVVYKEAIVNPEAKEFSLKKIEILKNKLKENSKDWESWISLGIYQKMAGDYEGAVLSWEYASAIAPNDYVSLSNLGNIYAYFMKDNGLAEVYYKEAISKSPMQPYLYYQLAEVYKDIFKDIDKAKNIIDEGLKKIPNDQSLLQMKSLLK